MNRITGKTIANVSIALVALSIVTTGCGGAKVKPVAWNVSITKATPASIEADVVGVSASDKPYWMNSVKPDDYWKANNSVRKGARISKILETGAPWVIERENPIWNEWFSYGATEIMIMANLPGGGDNSPFDRRRVFVTLDKNGWVSDKTKTLKIEVQDQFIRVLTPQKPRD